VLFAGEMQAFVDHPEQWPFLPVLERLSMAVAIGLFIGLEREFSGKMGARTFALTAILACMAGLAGPQFIWIAMAIVALTIVFINLRRLKKHDQLATTTSISFTIVAFCGILFGAGHVYTPALAGILTAALLTWKKPINSFVSGLSQEEVRSAILLAVLSLIIMPVLPAQPVDPWRLIDPRSNWASVVLIAGIGFINYILLRILGPRGMEITAFFGGLINSRKVIVEFITRLHQNSAALLPIVYRGVMLAMAAMALRNGVVVAVLARQKDAVLRCLAPLGLMFLISMLLWWRHPLEDPTHNSGPLSLESPFSLSAALKFGLVFLFLNVVGALAERNFGAASFYFVSVAGGLLSSGSSIASSATLISHHELNASTGINGVVLSSLTSVLINIPLLRRLSVESAYRKQITWGLVIIVAGGLIGAGMNLALFRS
jgi:uncharacterized membrane protein (DUF4010 family)